MAVKIVLIANAFPDNVLCPNCHGLMEKVFFEGDEKNHIISYKCDLCMVESTPDYLKGWWEGYEEGTHNKTGHKRLRG